MCLFLHRVSSKIVEAYNDSARKTRHFFSPFFIAHVTLATTFASWERYGAYIGPFQYYAAHFTLPVIPCAQAEKTRGRSHEEGDAGARYADLVDFLRNQNKAWYNAEREVAEKVGPLTTREGRKKTRATAVE